MYSKRYERIKNKISNLKYGEVGLNIINKLATGLVYFTYPIFIIGLALRKDQRLWKVILIPAISFLFLSIFRKILNLPRPYEKYDIDPIIKKDTKGNSFPSRHVFSAFVIGATLYKISPSIGLLLLFMGTIIGTVRVLGGVHFIIDVIAGGLIGIISSYIGWIMKIF